MYDLATWTTFCSVLGTSLLRRVLKTSGDVRREAATEVLIHRISEIASPNPLHAYGPCHSARSARKEQKGPYARSGLGDAISEVRRIKTYVTAFLRTYPDVLNSRGNSDVPTTEQKQPRLPSLT